MKLIFPQRRLGVIDRRVTAESCIDQCPTCGGVGTCPPVPPFLGCIDRGWRPGGLDPQGDPVPCVIRTGDTRVLGQWRMRYVGGEVIGGAVLIELVEPVTLTPTGLAPGPFPGPGFIHWGGTGRFRLVDQSGNVTTATLCIFAQTVTGSICPPAVIVTAPNVPVLVGGFSFRRATLYSPCGSRTVMCQPVNYTNAVVQSTGLPYYRDPPSFDYYAPQPWLGTLDLGPAGSAEPCPPQFEFGPCCFPDGSCSLGGASDCSAAGGVYLGSGASCNDCVRTGACCAAFQNPGGPADNCRVVTATACAGVGGAFRGIGSACAGQPCPTVGRCCLPNGGCAYSNENACILSSGIWTAGGVCGPGACPGQVGACCLPNQSCVPLSESACQAQLGTWRGAGVACPPTGQCLSGYLSACCISWNDGADHVRCFESVTCNECQAIAGSIVPPGTFPTVRCGIAAGQTCQDINCVPTGRPLIQPDRRVVLASTVPGGCAGCEDGGR